jgi:hypothetical protein
MKTPKKKVVKSKQCFFALLCDDGEPDILLCGVYPSLKEAREVAKAVKDCPLKHRIVKCSCTITYTPPNRTI